MTDPCCLATVMASIDWQYWGKWLTGGIVLFIVVLWKKA